MTAMMTMMTRRKARAATSRRVRTLVSSVEVFGLNGNLDVNEMKMYGKLILRCPYNPDEVMMRVFRPVQAQLPLELRALRPRALQLQARHLRWRLLQLQVAHLPLKQQQQERRPRRLQ